MHARRLGRRCRCMLTLALLAAFSFRPPQGTCLKDGNLQAVRQLEMPQGWDTSRNGVRQRGGRGVSARLGAHRQRNAYCRVNPPHST